eukprot:Seg1013.5 transcript_id=Seg1013.5/GoldUCD/mRNA.D3Y31 product="DNA excision repair protein ERCC-1" protein_id=Seg1013.5/GoldUCD/D3Y31
MTEKKKAAKRFALPTDEELDKPIESIRKGAAFSLSKRKNNGGGETSSGPDRGRSGLGHQQGLDRNAGKEKESAPVLQNDDGSSPSQNIKDYDGSSKALPKPKDRKQVEKQSAKQSNQNIKSAAKETQSSNEEKPTAFQDEKEMGDAAEEETEAVSIAQGKQNSADQQLSNIARPGTTNSIIVNARQRGNPVLKNVRNVPWEFGDIIPDYVLGLKSCALFLSLRYHNFNPDYIHNRLKQLGNRFELRIILVLVDVKDPHASLKELAKICILSDCTLILAWSNEEAGRYLETYKSYENKPADILQEKVEGDYQSKMTDCLTSVKSVNKTDAVTLMTNFQVL